MSSSTMVEEGVEDRAEALDDPGLDDDDGTREVGAFVSSSVRSVWESKESRDVIQAHETRNREQSRLAAEKQRRMRSRTLSRFDGGGVMPSRRLRSWRSVLLIILSFRFLAFLADLGGI